MKKVSFIAALLVIFSSGGFIGGYWYFLKTNIATVSIKNGSSKQVVSIRILYDKGEIAVSGLKKKKEKKIRFYTKENGMYRILATFDNDKNIESEGRQFEPGEIEKTVVLDTAIISR